MPDIAGAMAAIEQRLTDNWTTTAIRFSNDGNFGGAFDGSGNAIAWVHCEIENEDGGIVGAGKPGDQVNLDRGIIGIMVFVPTGTARATAREYASTIGEIFRVKEFYRAAGYCVRTWKPHVGRASEATSENPSGNWYCVPVTIPFEFISIC